MYIIKSNGASYTINKALAKDCDRNIFCDSATLPLQANVNHKYFEIVKFQNSTNADFAICIGLNPKWGRARQFDRSNQKLASWLKSKYKGFLLLNMFSVVTNDISELEEYMRANPNDVQNDMRDIIAEVVKISKCDIYLFYGQNAFKFVNANLSHALTQVFTTPTRNIFISENNGIFMHVGSQSCGSRMTANFVNYNTTYSNVF